MQTSQSAYWHVPAAADAGQALVAPRVHWEICILTFLCAAPTMALISQKALGPARLYFFGVLFVALAYFTILQRPYHVGSMIVALTPLLMLMRVLLFHNSVSVILALVIGVWIILDMQNLLRVTRDILVVSLLALSFLYWWISFEPRIPIPATSEYLSLPSAPPTWCCSRADAAS